MPNHDLLPAGPRKKQQQKTPADRYAKSISGSQAGSGIDHPEAVTQGRLQALMGNGPRTANGKALQATTSQIPQPQRPQQKAKPRKGIVGAAVDELRAIWRSSRSKTPRMLVPGASRDPLPAAATALAEPPGEEAELAVSEACDVVERIAVKRLKETDIRFRHWSPEQIAKDDSMRGAIAEVLADDATLLDPQVRRLISSGICMNEEAVRQTLLAEYESRQQPRYGAGHDKVRQTDPTKLAAYTSRYYDRDYSGRPALIASIIKQGAEYVPATYSRERVDDVITDMQDVELPNKTAEEILAEPEGEYYRAVIDAYHRRVEATSGAKGMGTQLGNAAGAHYSGVMNLGRRRP